MTRAVMSEVFDLEQVGEAALKTHRNEGEGKLGVLCLAPEAGMGIALMPSYLCREALQDGRLRPVLPDWVPRTKFGTLITALTTPDRLRVGRNRALLSFLRQDLQPGADQSQRASASLGT